MRYTIVLEPNEEGRGYPVRVPAGSVTEGATREEALANAREAIIGFIEGLEKAGEPCRRRRSRWSWSRGGLMLTKRVLPCFDNR